MANKAQLAEHSGAKKGRGAYAGRKRDAKRESNKLRRRESAAATHREIRQAAALNPDERW